MWAVYSHTKIVERLLVMMTVAHTGERLVIFEMLCFKYLQVLSQKVYSAIKVTVCIVSVCMYVIGSRWLMPPDALQPKAYCTNPAL